jgi:hypothetical protein
MHHNLSHDQYSWNISLDHSTPLELHKSKSVKAPTSFVPWHRHAHVLATGKRDLYDKDTYTVLAGQLFDSYALELVLRQLIKVHKLWGLRLDVSTYKHVDYLNLRMNNPNWFFLALWT